MSAGERSTGAPAAGGFGGILETSLYHAGSQADEVQRFYVDLLGLRPVSRWPGGIALRVGAGVLLLFDRDLLAERDGPISEHGSSGPGHACLLAPDGAAYEAWRERLSVAGVEITHEHDWAGGRRSLYFHDPAGNLLEIADADLWPR